jgi:hypothetical protein
MTFPSFLMAVTLCVILMMLPRKYFFLPFVVAACFLPMDQRVIIIDVDFTVLRILILVGILRLTIKNETRIIRWNYFDKLVLVWAVVGSLIFMAQHSNHAAFIYKLGVMYDTLGIYWLFRQITRDWSDVLDAIKIFAIVTILAAPMIALEKFVETSVFAIFGDAGGEFHRGRFRASGPFSHSIIMGCYYAILVPLFYSRIKGEGHKLFYWSAISAALSSVYFSASSTSILTLIAAIIFWNIYNYRMKGALLFKAGCASLLLLHMIMNAPVWHLISRIDLFSGSTGWHRYYLIDRFILNSQEWLLMGTMNTGKWGLGLNDITNQFVLEGVRGGLITLLVFIILIYFSIKIPGRYSLDNASPEIRWISWSICVTMLGHFVTFWGVSYFGQLNMLLYFTFALVGFTLEKNKEEDSVRAAKSSISPTCIPGLRGAGEKVVPSRRFNKIPYGLYKQGRGPD